MDKLEWESFKLQFHKSWHRWMQPAIESDWMYNIYQELKRSKEKVLPLSRDTFKSFKCDYDNLKAVLILSDPYPWIKNGKCVADGIPMSCSYTGVLQPSLEHFYTAMDNEFGEEVQREPNLSYLLDQGVLLINTALTVKVNKVGSHHSLWEPFMKYLFYECLFTCTGTPFWMMGDEAKKVEKWINSLGNHLMYSSHPASAEHQHTIWDSKGNFKLINTILKNNKRDEIWWNKKDWEMLEQLPF